MTDLLPGAARLANLQSVFSGAEFLTLLRQTVGVHGRAAVGDPLSLVVAQIRENSAFARSRLLLRLLGTLATGEGEFRRAEVATLDSAGLALVLALADARASGDLSPDACTQAIALAQTAPL